MAEIFGIVAGISGVIMNMHDLWLLIKEAKAKKERVGTVAEHLKAELKADHQAVKQHFELVLEMVQSDEYQFFQMGDAKVVEEYKTEVRNLIMKIKNYGQEIQSGRMCEKESNGGKIEELKKMAKKVAKLQIKFISSMDSNTVNVASFFEVKKMSANLKRLATEMQGNRDPKKFKEIIDSSGTRKHVAISDQAFEVNVHNPALDLDMAMKCGILDVPKGGSRSMVTILLSNAELPRLRFARELIAYYRLSGKHLTPEIHYLGSAILAASTDSGISGAAPKSCYVREYWGPSLHSLLQDSGVTFSTDDQLKLMLSVLACVEGIHGSGMLLRVFTSHGVLVNTESFEVRVSLFRYGISGEHSGSSDVLSGVPENEYRYWIKGNSAGPFNMNDFSKHTDIYAMAVVMREIITNQPAESFEGIDEHDRLLHAEGLKSAWDLIGVILEGDSKGQPSFLEMRDILTKSLALESFESALKVH